MVAGETAITSPTRSSKQIGMRVSLMNSLMIATATDFFVPAQLRPRCRHLNE